jgi:DNA-binding transcriptional ArsR family regulator
VSDLTATLAALADPTRRAALQRLAYGPATASQLAALTPSISRPAVSQHLKVLREAGLVRATQSGRHVFYELSGASLLETQRWLGALVEQWTRAPVLDLGTPAKERA